MAARPSVPATRGNVFATGFLGREPLLKLKQRLGETVPQHLVMGLCHLDISLISIEHSYVAGLKQRGMVCPDVLEATTKGLIKSLCLRRLIDLGQESSEHNHTFLTKLSCLSDIFARG